MTKTKRILPTWPLSIRNALNKLMANRIDPLIIHIYDRPRSLISCHIIQSKFRPYLDMQFSCFPLPPPPHGQRELNDEFQDNLARTLRTVPCRSLKAANERKTSCTSIRAIRLVLVTLTHRQSCPRLGLAPPLYHPHFPHSRLVEITQLPHPLLPHRHFLPPGS